MPRLKRDVQPLLDRAIESLALAIELFNRPAEGGRKHSVLLLLHHSFEMLLKAAILQKSGSIHEADDKYTYSFARCLGVGVGLQLLTDDERTTLAILDAQRDTAMHFYADLSEEVLYVHTQAGVTLFKDLLWRAFGKRLSAHLPNRVMPVSVQPPGDLASLLSAELSEVDELLGDGTRRGARARARLRSLLAFTATGGDDDRITENALDRAVRRRRRREEWSVILPEIAGLRLTTDGGGQPITMRISKQGTVAVRIAAPGEAVEGFIVKQEVNPFDKFNMSINDLAQKVSLTQPRALAVVYELGIQDDREAFRELAMGAVRSKRYSKRALDKIRSALEGGLNVDNVWAKHRHQFTARRSLVRVRTGTTESARRSG